MRWPNRPTLRQLIERLDRKVEKIMATQGDDQAALDAALTGLETQDAAEAAAITKLTSTVAANSAVIKQLEEELAAAGGQPSPSLAAEIARVQALNTADTSGATAIGAATTQIGADDATATPPATTPPATNTPPAASP